MGEMKTRTQFDAWLGTRRVETAIDQTWRGPINRGDGCGNFIQRVDQLPTIRRYSMINPETIDTLTVSHYFPLVWVELLEVRLRRSKTIFPHC